MLRSIRPVGTLAAPLIALASATPALALADDGGTTERASLDSAEQEVSGDSLRPVISAEGRHVAFFSDAPDLVPGDTNGGFDVFVRDRLTGTTTRVSVGPGGVQANRESFNGLDNGRGVSISAAGRYVAFHSRAYNLVTNDTNDNWDCFVHDRDPDGNGVFDEGNGVTQLVSVDSNGGQYASYGSYEPWISAGGRYVAFHSRGILHPGDTNAVMDVYVRDRKTATTYLVSMDGAGGAGNGDSTNAVISGSGAYVAYQSVATNLVTDDTNGVQDIYLTAWQSVLTQRVSVGPGGLQADGPSSTPSISGSGLRVAFSSRATNLHAKDTNDFEDVFVHDVPLALTVPVSVRPGGSTADDDSLHPSISPNGRFVAFESLATDMTPIQSYHFRDVFVADLELGLIAWNSPAYVGNWTYPHANGRSRWPSIGADMRRVAFESEATNLVVGDGNDAWDVFVRVRNPAWRGPTL